MKSRWLFPAVIILTASSALAQGFGQNRVRYDKFSWEVLSTPHFRVSFYDRGRPQLAKVASFAESAYDDLARRLNFQIIEPIPLIVYATHAEFEQTNVIQAFIAEGIGAFATPARNRMVMPVDLPDVQLQKLIQHELTHIFQYEILFQGKLGKALTSRPPQWFMEGMASYFADDEDSRATAVMRDSVASDRVPSVADDVGGYFAYRFGHMVFKFVEAEWGIEGVRDFVFELRNSLGTNIKRTLKRAFDLEPDEFDARFRSWLRKFYQPLMLDRGDPREFGQVFRTSDFDRTTYESSPAASPSGDLIAAFSTYKDDIDVVLLGVPTRTLFRNLTRGNTTSYQYLIAQLLTTGPDRGRDLAFSPDGNRVAVFARHERGRELLLLDAINGGIARTYPITPDQAMEPAFSPDGRTIAFHAYANGQADIYLLDVDSGEVRNLTNDPAYDADPTFAPDGASLLYSSQTGEFSKIFRISLATPAGRQQLTFGTGDDEGATYSRDGKRIFFSSDRDQGIFDVYVVDLATRSLGRLTRVYGAALNPVVVPTTEGERVIYQAYTKGRWRLYMSDPAQAKPAGSNEPPVEVTQRPAYVPSVTVAVTPEKIEPARSRKLFVDDVNVLVGVNEDNTIISQTYLSFADQYGDRRFNALFESVDQFSNIQLSWVNLTNRLQWGITVFDDRTYYTTTDIERPGRRDRQGYRQTGLAGFAQYPLSIYHRATAAAGYLDRSISYPTLTQEFQLVYLEQNDKMPFVQAGLIGDTSFYRNYGPHAGRRYQLNASYAYDTRNKGALSWDLNFDGRQYVPLSSRNELAFRLWGAYASGNRPNFYYFGGLDTVRGFDYRSLQGNRAFYLNTEWRFPLIDHIVLPWLHIQEVRGRFFLDVAGAWYDIPAYNLELSGQMFPIPAYRQNFRFSKDGRLQDAVSSYGFGISLNLFGLPAHWDFSKRWDFKDTFDPGYATAFWIGYRY